MHREDKFVLSHRPYAVDPTTLRLRFAYEGAWDSWMIDAVWFRRRRDVTAACVGFLTTLVDAKPTDYRGFLESYEDGRYGGKCLARWDGSSIWYAGQDPEENAQHLELLRTVLDAYHANPKAPELGSRWDRWWRF